MLGKLIANDVFKQKRTMLAFIIIAVPIFTSLLLAVDLGIRYKDYLYPLALKKGITSWQMLLHEQRLVFFKEYLPLFGAVIISSIFDNEYKNNGWTLELTFPVSKERIILSKFIASLIFMTAMLTVNIISLILVGKLMGFPEAVEGIYFVKMFFIQLISVASVMTIHLYLTIKNKNTLISIITAGLICVVSSDLYYKGSSISKFNPYSFTSFSDGLTDINVTLIVTAALILMIAGLAYTIRYFKKKQCY